MLRHCFCCCCFILVDIIVKSTAQAPSWSVPSSTSITIDGTDLTNECVFITELFATPGDATPVSYSIHSQTPNGGFSVFDNTLAGQDELQCTDSLITVSSYTVVVRDSTCVQCTCAGDNLTAIQDQGGNGQHTDLSLTISVSGLTPATGPTCSQTTSLSLDLSDNTACDSVTSLTCTSSDTSSVTYSIQSQSSSGVFSLSSSTLTCTLSSIVADTTYTVDVRAQNSGNSATTDISFTITASSGSGSNGSGSGSSSGGNNHTGAIVGGVIGGIAGCILMAACGYFLYKVYDKRKVHVNTEKSSKLPEGNEGESEENHITEKGDIRNEKTVELE